MTGRTSLLGRVRSAHMGGASLDGLARLITADLPRDHGPVPIELACDRLGIGAVAVADIGGAAGMLLRHADLAKPVILVRASDPVRRRRFSVAHELAHLALGHLELGRDADRAEEAQADRLAALILAPPARVAGMLRGRRADVADVRRVADAFEISLDAAARAYVEFHPDPVAVLMSRGGRVERIYRGRSGFPRLAVSLGDPLPPASAPLGSSGSPSSTGTHALAATADWVRAGRGARTPVVGQVLRWRSGGSLVVLSLEGAEKRSCA